MRVPYPFTAIVGQERLKTGLIINAVNPSVGGILITGPKGVAKSTAVRALRDILPEIEVVSDCTFSCDPNDETNMCSRCRERKSRGEVLPISRRKMRIVDLPISATLDRVVGTLDIKRVLETGERILLPGLLAEANRGIIYIDEVNLLDDAVVDAILDASASGWNIVEREGVSFTHPSKFILIGTMNPEEGELRPQLLDRFGISVNAEIPESEEELMEIVKRVEEYERDPEGFYRGYGERQRELSSRILKARAILQEVRVSDDLMRSTARLIIKYRLSNRAMIFTIRAAKTIAALDLRTEVQPSDIREALKFTLGHRLRENEMERAIKEAESELHEERQEDGETSDVTKGKEEGRDGLEGGKVEGGESPTSQKTTPEEEGGRPSKFTTVNFLKGGKGGGGGRLSIGGRSRDYGIRKGTRINLWRSIVSMSSRGSRRLHYYDLCFTEERGNSAREILVLLDASKSMSGRSRIGFLKNLMEGLSEEAYRKRSPVGLVLIHEGRVTRQNFSKNYSRIRRMVDNISAKGKTPLPLALREAIVVTRKIKMQGRIPLTLILSDGIPNVSPGGGDPWEEAKVEANRLKLYSEPLLIRTGRNFVPSPLAEIIPVIELSGNEEFVDLTVGNSSRHT